LGSRRYILTKIGQALLTLLFVLTFNFFLFRATGDPAANLLRGSGRPVSQGTYDQLTKTLGLNLPLPQQFVHYLRETASGNLGYSFYSQQPVSTSIAAAIWPTVLLIGGSTIASIVIGVWIGITQGWRRGTRYDQGMLGFTMFTYAMPEFWFGMLMIMAFAVGVGPFPAIFPSGGYETVGAGYTGMQHVIDVLNHMILPFMVLTISYLGEYSLIMRSSMIETLGEDYIHLARAKGLRDKSVRSRHAVPNALLPTLTITILSLGFVISGAITIELVFNWPGLGLLTANAIKNNDFPMLEGLFLLFSASIILANLVADLMYSYFDPRVRAA
jgi:peptide/nickel transport system permease protein